MNSLLNNSSPLPFTKRLTSNVILRSPDFIGMTKNLSAEEIGRDSSLSLRITGR
jgi:hypothetical protein